MNNEIKIALQQHEALLAPPLPTVFENANFEDIEGAAQAFFYLFAEPDDAGHKDSDFIQRGIFTIALGYPTNTGSADADERAKAIREHFKRGTSIMTTAGFSVIIDRTPEITGGAIEETKFVVRVRIRFYAQIPA